MVPVIGATAPPWAPEPLTPARYLGTGTDTCALPSCAKRAEAGVRRPSREPVGRRRSEYSPPSWLRQRPDLGEEVHRVVQDDQLGTRLHAVDGAVQEGGSAFRLHLPSHMVRLFTNLETTTKKKIVNDKCANFPPKSNKTLSDCWMLVVLLAVASDWTGRRSPASCSSHPCCKRRPRRLLPMKSTHGRGELCHRAQRAELWRERGGETLGSGAGKQDSFQASQRRFFLIGRLNNERGFVKRAAAPDFIIQTAVKHIRSEVTRLITTLCNSFELIQIILLHHCIVCPSALLQHLPARWPSRNSVYSLASRGES